MSASLCKILLICFLTRSMLIKQTFLKICKPPPPVFSWNISEFSRITVLKSTHKQMLLYLIQFNSVCILSKNVFFRETIIQSVVIFKISHIFPKNFIEIPQLVQKIWNFFSSVLTIFINILDFFIFPCCKETNDVTCNRWRQHLL